MYFYLYLRYLNGLSTARTCEQAITTTTLTLQLHVHYTTTTLLLLMTTLFHWALVSAVSLSLHLAAVTTLHYTTLHYTTLHYSLLIYTDTDMYH